MISWASVPTRKESKEMSTRTVIEINHDYLSNLEKYPEQFLDMLKALRGSSITGELNNGLTPIVADGVRVLGQRHHSERLKLEIK